MRFSAEAHGSRGLFPGIHWGVVQPAARSILNHDVLGFDSEAPQPDRCMRPPDRRAITGTRSAAEKAPAFEAGAGVSNPSGCALDRVPNGPSSGPSPGPTSASAHDLRRAFGVRWAARLTTTQLMELVRHESIETTLRFYVGTDAQRTAEAAWAAFDAHRRAFSAAEGTSLANSAPDGDFEATPAEERASLKNRDARE